MTDAKNTRQRIHRAESQSQWLNSSGELYVCAVQPPEPDQSTILKDDSRPQALEIAEALLGTGSSAKPRVSRWSQSDPALVVFPELAFGTGDFAELDGLIAKLPSPALVLAGFGFCSGDRLGKLLEEHSELETAWPGRAVFDPDGTYNGGWCWLHRPGEQARRIVFLKNWAEQGVEIAKVDRWTPGSHILRLNTDDLTVFPLICADLIRRGKGGPRARILSSLAEERPRGPVLVPALLYDQKPHSGFWKAALNELISQDHVREFTVFLVNHSRPAPKRKEREDAWRSLTGAFVSRRHVSAPPSANLAHVRFAETDETRGLVLRLTEEPGVAAGSLRWRFGSDLGRHVWSPNRRFAWHESKLCEVMGGVEAHELSRFLVRYKRTLTTDTAKKLRPTLMQRLEDLRHCLRRDPKGEWVGNLWPRVLVGVREGKARSYDPDRLHEYDSFLSRALLILASFCDAELASLVEERLDDAQLVMDSDHHLMVWCDPELRPKRQIRELESLLFRTGSPALFVVGSSGRGRNPGRQRVKPRGRNDITDPHSLSEAPRHVTELRALRSVWWLDLGAFEDILDSADWNQIGPRKIPNKLNDRLRREILGLQV